MVTSAKVYITFCSVASEAVPIVMAFPMMTLPWSYLQIGVKAIMGNYVLGRLEGQAKMVMADGSCRHCWAQLGWLHGPCR